MRYPYKAKMKIHLIRHGKTMANEQKLYCGATDIPLSEAGIAELCSLKEQNIYPKSAGVYYTSGFKRTEQTLDLLYGSVQRSALPEFAEFRFGCFEMQSYEMLKGQNDYQMWITDETGLVTCPGGDNKQGFTRRVIDGYIKLTSNARNELDSLIVCHGGVIACIMEYLFPDTHNFYEWQPKPGRGYTLTRATDGLKLIQLI